MDPNPPRHCFKSRCDYILGTDRSLFQAIRIKDPRHFTSDHYMLVGTLRAAPPKSHQKYLRGRKAFPLKPPKWGPITKSDSLYLALKNQTAPDPHPNHPRRPHWLSPTTLQFVDRRCVLRQNPHHDRAEARRLTRAINVGKKHDRLTRATETAHKIEAALSANDPQKAYGALKAWYKFTGDRPHKPTHHDLLTITKDFTALYTKEDPSPPGEPIPAMVAPFDITDSIPEEPEIRAALMRLRLHKAPGPSGMTVQHLRDWLAAAERKKNPDPTPWRALVDLIQHVFHSGNIPTQLCWSYLTLLPKPDGGARGIGLLEVLWKLIEAIIDTRVRAAVTLHDTLHGFLACRGTGTAILEVKLHQELAGIRKVPLFQVYLDLRKAYDTIDHPRLLQTFQDYGMGPNLIRLLTNFWEGHRIVPRQQGYNGPAIQASRGQIQGGIFPPMGFNLLAN